MKRILITGSEGFIGTNLQKYLYDKGYICLCYDLIDGNDILSDQFEVALKTSEASIVIHLAALTSVAQSFKNPEEVFITNVLGTARVAYLCKKYNKKLIYSSSMAVYHPELSPYANTKYLAEEIVKGIENSVILRFANVFGEGMNPASGSIMYNFLHDKELVVYGDGEQTRDYIHVRDIVRVLEDALKDKWNGKIVEVGMGQSYSANYVAGLFAHFRGLKIQYKPARREIKWSITNTQMLKSLYKKKLTTNLEKDIAELCNR